MFASPLFGVEQVETAYDGAGNVLQSTTRRRFHNATGTGELTAPDGSQPKARVSYVALWYDALGRQTAVANYGTNDGDSLSRPAEVPSRSDYILVTTTEYNSDGEAFKTIDPMGREDRQEFNDAGGRTKLIENYDDGDPTTGTSDKDRTTLFTYNADGLLKTLTAKNPTTGDQVTTYVYGTALTDSDISRSDLLRAVIYPDSDDVESPLGDGADSTYDRVEHKYNRQGELKETKDQNGTIHAFDFDKLGRVTQDRITTLGTNIDGAVRRIRRTYEVRGLVEKITSYDNATVGSGNVVNEVKLEYNTFGQLVKDYQEHSGAVNTSTTPKVQYDYANGSANHTRLTKMTYPNGPILRYEYNSGADANLGRISFLGDDASGSVGTHLAEYAYVGLASIVQVDYTEPDIRFDLAHGSGDDPYDGMDRFGRIVDLLWRDYGGSVDAERIKHGYDRVSNRLWRECPVAAAQSTPVHQDELYSYDGVYQLANFQRGDLNSTKDGITSGTTTYAQEWTFDATGNWASFKDDTNGDGTWELNQSRAHNKANEITAFTGGSWASPTHDHAGNMTALPQPNAPSSGHAGTYDAWNRLVKLMDGAATVGEYAYDGGTRRTKKVVSSIIRHFYFTTNWQDLEERLGASSSADRQFVWGLRYIDDLALRDRDTDSNGTLDERLYGLQDPNWNLTAISDTSGLIVERYRYSAYGQPITLNADFSLRSSGTSYAWHILLCGYQGDSESGLYVVRRRFLHGSIGRWLTVDPIGYASGDANRFRYVSNHPIVGTDPTGLVTRTFPCSLPKGQKQITVDFDDCPGWEFYLGYQLCNAAKIAWKAYLAASFVNQNFRPGPRPLPTAEAAAVAAMRPHLDHWFSTPVPHPTAQNATVSGLITKPDLEGVVKVLGEIAAGFQNTISVECCGCSEGEYAQCDKPQINICPKYFDLSYARQVAALLHEMSHCYSTTVDHHCLGGSVPLPRPFAPEYESGGQNIPISSPTAIGNAPTYEWFFWDVYLR